MESATRDHVLQVDADGFDSRRILVPLFCCVWILLGGFQVYSAVYHYGEDPRSAWVPVLVLGSVYFLLMCCVYALYRSGRWPAARSWMGTAISATAPIWVFAPGVVMGPTIWSGLALITAAMFVLSLPRVESATTPGKSAKAR